ncbi:MAG TPA: hypothetical protein PKV98_07885 [Burkholderiaceae bacterium]|nr:hypothetical protein [Burkholderiaceae bacterium]
MPRGRKPNVEPSLATNLHLPESVRTRLDLLLHSPLEGRVPKGAYQRFFLERLTEFFGTRQLDLSPYVSSLPGERVVRGSPETLAVLEAALQAKQQP